MKKIIRALILVFALTAVLATFAACEKEQPKTKLETPIVASQVYTGSKLTAEVPQNDGYRVISNEGGTDAGEYDVVLELTDATKYEWAAPDSDDATKVTLKFVVTKATNGISGLSLEGWTYGEEAKMPVATAQFGAPTFTYSATADGTFTETVPTAAGSYFVKATVAATANYDGAEKTVEFKIGRANAALTTIPTAVANLVYTGGAHDLITAGVADGGTMQYKLGDNGTWSSDIPTATNAGEYTVYYKVIGDDNHKDIAEANVTVGIAKAASTFGKLPQALDLSYTGAAQELLSAGETTCGKIWYKLGNGEWTNEIPTATEAKTYYVYYKIVGDNNHNDLIVDETEERLTITISRVADSIDFSLDNVTVRCGDSVPELTATSTSGTAVTFAYSDNGNDFYAKDQLGDFTFTYGTTYYVKATVADSANYTGTEKTLTITPQHDITVSENDGVQTAACQCGKKDVTGTLGTKQTIDLAATVDNGQVKTTDGKLDLTTIGYNGNAEVTLAVGNTTYHATAQNGVVGLADVLPLGIYGEKTFAVSVTDGKETYNVTVKALVVTMTITTADQYANWITVAKACEQSATLWGGYFRLGANITATSMVMFTRGETDGTEGFKGVFDGCGYVIDGLNRNSGDSNAFVTTMTETGVLKNIAFTNVKITGAGNFLTSGGKGTIENVFVQYTGISAGGQYNGTIASCQSGCAMRNIFVDASNAVVSGSGTKFRILTSNTEYGFNGVFGVCPSENYTPSQAIDRDNNYAAIAYFADFAELKDNVKTKSVLKGWNNNGFWIVNDGVPAPQNYVANGINLVAKYIDLDILVDNDAVKLNDNALEIDCTAVGFTFGNVASVTMEGNALDVSKFTFADRKLSVVRSAFGYNYGEKQIVVTDDDGKTITIAATLVSKVLKNATDYANWIKIAKACEQSATLWGGYFRLGANITATSMVMFTRGETDGTEGFKGVFDGCGYVIDGLNRSSYDSNAFVTTMTETGVLKNIAFTNVKITGEGNFLCSGGLGTIENVYVQYTEISVGSDYNGTIYNHCGGKITNVFVDASQAVLSGSGASFRLIGGANEGYNGIFAVCPKGYTLTQARGGGSLVAKAVCAFASFADLKANDTTQGVLKGWDSTYWTIVDGVPVFATK